MIAEQLALDLWAAPADEAIIAEITTLAERAGFTATPTRVFGGRLDFFVTHHLGACTIASPDAARRILTRMPEST